MKIINSVERKSVKTVEILIEVKVEKVGAYLYCASKVF